MQDFKSYAKKLSENIQITIQREIDLVKATKSQNNITPYILDTSATARLALNKEHPISKMLIELLEDKGVHYYVTAAEITNQLSTRGKYKIHYRLKLRPMSKTFDGDGSCAVDINIIV